MVLHLLGKKGWNVYNHDNVERVRRDEAAAQAREEAREQRMQDEDAARRLAILRGEDPPPPPPPELTGPEDASLDEPQHSSARGHDRPRKRRRLRGEDDTDAEIRLARQDVEAGEQARSTLARAGREHEDAPLLDHAGHLQLIPAPDEKAIRKAEKTTEDAKKRKRETEQYQMRFEHAAGFNRSVGQKPWYAATEHQPSAVRGLVETQGKDVWGNEDPLRKERERNRVSASDPFAAMQSAQRQLKQSERDREGWRREREREREMEEMRRAEKVASKERKKRERSGREGDVGSLEGFSLDAVAGEKGHGKHRHHHHHHRHRRRRSRSRSRSRDRRR